MNQIFGNKRRWDYNVFRRWHLAVVELELESCYYNADYRAFEDYECAAVSVLCAVAGRARFFAVAEAYSEKKERNDLRRHTKRGGRGDLWLITDGYRSHSFEFKVAEKDAEGDRLFECLQLASDDIRVVPKSDHDSAYGGLIAPCSPGVRRGDMRSDLRCHFQLQVFRPDGHGVDIFFRDHPVL